MINFRDYLSKNDVLFYNTVGNSMRPLICQGRDLVIVVAKPKHPLHKGDVPLYLRPNGQYVLHRIVKTPKIVPGKEVCYCCCGDNRTVLENDVLDSYVVGVLQAVVRKGKRVETTDIGYRIYWHYIIISRPWRAIKHSVCNLLHHVFRNS